MVFVTVFVTVFFLAVIGAPLLPLGWQAYRPGAAAERMHLIAQPLIPRALAARCLFVPPGDRAEALAAVKREVNAKVGRWAVRSGATLPLTRVYNDPSNAHDICDVRGKSCF
jgi:hypothetical protein